MRRGRWGRRTAGTGRAARRLRAMRTPPPRASASPLPCPAPAACSAAAPLVPAAARATDAPVTAPPSDGPAARPRAPARKLVVPKPGQLDVHHVRPTRSRPGRRLHDHRDRTWTSGVEPCTSSTIVGRQGRQDYTITLREGRGPKRSPASRSPSSTGPRSRSRTSRPGHLHDHRRDRRRRPDRGHRRLAREPAPRRRTTPRAGRPGRRAPERPVRPSRREPARPRRDPAGRARRHPRVPVRGPAAGRRPARRDRRRRAAILALPALAEPLAALPAGIRPFVVLGGLLLPSGSASRSGRPSAGRSRERSGPACSARPTGRRRPRPAPRRRCSSSGWPAACSRSGRCPA